MRFRRQPPQPGMTREAHAEEKSRRSPMSDLIVIGYPDEATAGHVWRELINLQNGYLVDLDAAAIIRRDSKGKLHVTTPAHHAVARGHAERPVLGRAARTAVPVPARPAGRRGRRHHGGSARGRRGYRDQGRLQPTRAGPGAAGDLRHPSSSSARPSRTSCWRRCSRTAGQSCRPRSRTTRSSSLCAHCTRMTQLRRPGSSRGLRRVPA